MTTVPSRHPIVLYGAGAHAREVAEIVLHVRDEAGGPGLLGFLDDRPDKHGAVIDDFPVLGGLDWLASHTSEVEVIVAIGDVAVRKRLALEIEAMGAKFGRAISPLAHLSKRAQIGVGCMVFPRAVVSTNVSIGRHVILGVHSNVSHDSTVGDYSFVCPAAILTGGVTLGDEVMLGSNATVIPGRQIGSRSVIGAGACVVRDIPADSLALGVPAKVCKRLIDQPI